MSDTRARELRLPRQVYRLRVLGLGIGILGIAAVFHERGASALAWGGLAFHGFVWPHIAWLHARSSRDPHRAERINLTVDSTLGGAWVALMHFALLPSVLIVAMLSMDKVGWGLRFLARTSAAMATACLLTTLVVTGGAFDLTTSMTMIWWTLPLMVAYPLSVAFVSEKSGRMARERRKAVEEMAAMREQLAHVARVGTLGEMAAGLAHELNQPLTAIHLEASAALENAGDPAPMRDALTVIGSQALRAGEIVRRMRTFARPAKPQRRAYDIRQVIQEVLTLLTHDLRTHGIETALQLRDDVPLVLADRVELQQVLVNLIRNAIDAMTTPGVTTRRLTIVAERAGTGARVTIADTGPGIDPVIATKLFHPFQTTKPSGLGLGLSICQSLVEANGGRIATMPAATGALFRIDFPPAES